MSDQLRSPSRRALLRAAGLAPLALLGAATLQQKTQDEINALVAEQTTLSEDERRKVGRIVVELWSWFEYGVSPSTTIQDGVIAMGWAMSSSYILGNIRDWPDDANHNPTLGCAFVCGNKASSIAGPGPVTPEVFEKAWKQTEKEQKASIERARKIGRYKGKDDLKSWGLGC
jgi:hypothetical protein